MAPVAPVAPVSPVAPVGFGSVVKFSVFPLVVPPPFVAITRYWYVVFAVSPPTIADSVTGPVPDPGDG
jgi:hypothetical protein